MPFQAAARIISATGALTTSVGADSVPTVTMPAIANAPVAPQAKPDDLVLCRADPLYGGTVFDNSRGGVVVARLAPYELAVFRASPNGVWDRVPPASVMSTILHEAPAVGGGTLAFGSGTAPAVITTPGTIAGTFPVLLDDLTVGYVAYHK